MQKKILIVQPLLAHYRHSLFQRLVNTDEFKIQVIAGKQINNIKEIPTGSPNIIACLDNKKFKIAGHVFIWQAGVVKYTLRQKPDFVVLTGVDPHLVSNLYLSLVCDLFLKTKVIWWGHADLDKKGYFGKMFRLFFFNLSEGAIAYNDVGKKNIEDMMKKRIKVISVKNCINDDEYGYNQPTSPASSKQGINGISVLFSGRLTKEKRLDILIEALSILKMQHIRFNCILIGNGDEKAALQELIHKRQLAGLVQLTGEKYQQECYPFFNSSDLFVLPGKVGLSIIHGLSYGLPVITSDKLEIHSPEYEIIKKGYNGDFFHRLDSKDLAAKIVLWSRRIEEEGKDIIKKRCVASIVDGGYTSASMQEKMIDFFKTLNK